MWRFRSVVLSTLILLALTGISMAKVTAQNPQEAGQLPRPATVWVSDFVATPTDLPSDSALVGIYSKEEKPQTKEQIATGRKLGKQIAEQLVKQIRDMKMTAQRLDKGKTPKVNDIVISGCIVSFSEGDASKRVGIGLGAGSSELHAAAEGYQVTIDGKRKLGFGESDTGSSKTPGTAVGAAAFVATANPLGLIVGTAMKVRGEKTGKSKIEGRVDQTAKDIADVLKKRFEKQGWL